MKPSMDINLVIGGMFKEGRNELVDTEEGIGFFKLQKQQLMCIFKYLDYSTNYTKFQTGVQKKFLERKFTKDESKKYIKLYEEWKMNDGDDKSKAEKKKADKLKVELCELERDFSYESIAAIRQVTINKYNLEYRKKIERERMLKRIKEFEDSKAQGYFSGFWGGKSEEEKDKDEKDVNDFKNKLNKEFQDKFSDEETKVEDKLNQMLTTDPIFDQEALHDMPLDWVASIYSIIIPKLRIVLLDEDSRATKEKAIIEIQSSGMKTKMLMGRDWQEMDLSFGKLNIIDNFS